MREALTTDPQFAIFLESEIKPSLPVFATCEYSSRLIQVMVHHSQTLRTAIIAWATTNFLDVIQNRSSIFLLAASLEMVLSPVELLQLRKTIFWTEVGTKLKGNKYFKRIMAAYGENCSENDLDLIFDFFDVSANVLRLLSEIFGAFLIGSLIVRNHQPTVKLFLQLIKSDLKTLLKAKNLKHFIFDLAKRKDAQPIKRTILITLITSDQKIMKEILKKQIRTYFLAYIVVQLLNPTDRRILEQFEIHTSQHSQLKNLLMSLQSFVLP